MNEYLYNYMLKLKRNTLPSRIVFFVTNKCNLSCKHCFYQNKLGKEIKELSLSEIQKISSSLARVYTLLISGGEPFLRTDLSEICKIFYRQNKTKIIFIPTNGIPIEKILATTEDTAKKCKYCKIIIGVSLDGPREKNDSVRETGAFDTALKNLSLICELKKRHSNLSISVCTTIFNEDSRDTIRLFELIKNELDIAYHGFAPFRGLTENNLLSSPSYENWKNIANKLINFDRYYFVKGKEKGIRLRFHILIKKYIYDIIAMSLNNKKWPFKCLAGHLFGVIEPNGDVRMCEYSRTIGNLRKTGYNFKKVWFSQEAKIIREGAKNALIPECSHCTQGCPLVPSLAHSPTNLFKAVFGLY